MGFLALNFAFLDNNCPTAKIGRWQLPPLVPCLRYDASGHFTTVACVFWHRHNVIFVYYRPPKICFTADLLKVNFTLAEYRVFIVYFVYFVSFSSEKQL